IVSDRGYIDRTGAKFDSETISMEYGDGLSNYGGSFVFSFSEPGVYHYHESARPWLNGTVTVLPFSYSQELTSDSNENGAAQGVHLIVSTDKQAYLKNENVSFTLSIQNNDEKPFAITDWKYSVTITQEATGKQVYQTIAAAQSATYPIVQPRSAYTIRDFPILWNQIDADSNSSVNPGQ